MENEKVYFNKTLGKTNCYVSKNYVLFNGHLIPKQSIASVSITKSPMMWVLIIIGIMLVFTLYGIIISIILWIIAYGMRDRKNILIRSNSISFVNIESDNGKDVEELFHSIRMALNDNTPDTTNAQ